MERAPVSTHLILTLDGLPNDGNSSDDNGSRRDHIQSDIENVAGGEASDTITGNPDDNVLNGNGGHDLLDGGAGADDIIGGVGRDVVNYGGRSTGVVVTLAGGADDGNAEDDDHGSRRDNVTSVGEVLATVHDDHLTGSPRRTTSTAASVTRSPVSATTTPCTETAERTRSQAMTATTSWPVVRARTT